VIAGQDAVRHGLSEQIRDRAESEIVLVEPDGRQLGADVALVEIARRLGWPVGFLHAAPFRLLTRPAYRLLANNRRRFAPFFFRSEDD